MFRRRRSSSNEDEVEDNLDATEDGAADSGEPSGGVAPDEDEEVVDVRANGPWDLSEVAAHTDDDAVDAVDDDYDDDEYEDEYDDEYDENDANAADEPASTEQAEPASPAPAGAERVHLDLGAVRIRPIMGMQVRIEVDEATREVRAITVIDNDSAMQLQPFAAPRTSGLWADIRQELAADVTKRGGTATFVPGTWGKELRASLPVRSAEGRQGTQLSRIVGIDGPRWMLRAPYLGRAVDPAKAERLDEVLRSVIVVRGPLPMAPGDPLPLTMPAEAVAVPDAQQAAGGRTESPLGPLERGPEMTETR